MYLSGYYRLYITFVNAAPFYKNTAAGLKNASLLKNLAAFLSRKKSNFNS